MAKIPVQLSTNDGTITPTPDGSTLTFYLVGPPKGCIVFKNGVLMTQPLDVVFGGSVISFPQSMIPNTGDVITAEVWY